MSTPFTHSFWMDQALAREADSQQQDQTEKSPLTGHQQTDICIVGAGFTGLWCAITLKQANPTQRIVVLEKNLSGSGASGRNGGCLLTWSAKYLSLKKLFGEAQAQWLVKVSEQAVHEIDQFCQKHQIQADLRLEGTLYTATNRAQQGGMTPVINALNQAGINQWQSVESDNVTKMCGSSVHQEAVFSPHAGSVQPALLVRGLLRVAREMGVEVYEHSPMLRIDKGDPATVHTPDATLEARQVVLALNSAMVDHFREFRRSIVLVSSDMVITQPDPDALTAQQMQHGRSVVDGRTFVYYYRSTSDGRLMLGKGGNTFAFANRHLAQFDQPSRYRTPLTAALKQFFPKLANTPVAASWCGASDRSVDGLPFFGHWRNSNNIVYGLGYSGNGVAQSWIGGQILAALVQKQDNDWTRCALNNGPRGYFPPEPFRWIGAMLVRNAIRRKEQAEDRNQTPRWYDKQLAKLADAAGKADKS
ncbi:MAG: FAD-dependent oxidoreductase [Plesiomonas sp.]|uniref:FAD-dependent oxidoreductase n=1 Tax=Plesiomonas sp. TaxID=2486279 RepID=UPI003EE78D95